MNLFRNSLYWRLLVWFCLANLLVLVLGGYLTRRFVEYSTAVEIDWASVAQEANQSYESGGSRALLQWSREQRHKGMSATLFENGQPLSPVWLPPPLRASLPGLLDTGHDILMRPSPQMYLAVQQVVGNDGQVRQLVALSRSHSRLRRQTREKILLVVQLSLSLLIIGLIGWWVARGVARPVEALRLATRRMAAGELSARVGSPARTTHRELSDLAHDFDAMAERIEALVAHDRGVLQDLSHELRSPLARLHLILDLAQRSDGAAEADSYFQQAEQEIVRLDRMAGEMLALSRLEGGLPGMEREPVELSELIRECVSRALLEADARHLRLRPVTDAAAVVSGSAILLERALDNLLANAIKFSPEGGDIDLGVQVHDGHAVLFVRDHGPGVPPSELESLFRPFFRGSNAARADGHGVGLTIVQRVAKVHGGSVEAVNAQGGGLEVRMELPLAQAGANS